jgi:hypothetical protein
MSRAIHADARGSPAACEGLKSSLGGGRRSDLLKADWLLPDRQDVGIGDVAEGERPNPGSIQVIPWL